MAVDSVDPSAARPPAVTALRLAEWLLLVLAALALCSLFILLSGNDPLATFATLLGHALLDGNGLAEVLVRAIPLTLLGVGIAVAFRANVFNIGADGQLILGALLAVGVGLHLAGWPGWLALPAFLLLGALGGALYGGLAGWLRARFGANEIIVTIMLNYIALQLLGWAIRGPLQEAMGVFPRSDVLPPNQMLDVLVPGTRIHAGLLVAVLVTLGAALVMRFTSFGFQLAAVGRNPAAARYGGIDDKLVVFLAMAISGGCAGLAGAVEIAGIHQRLQDDFASGYGLSAIAVALLAGLRPIWVPLPALLFAVLYVGSGAIQRQLGVPFPIAYIIEGLVILTFLAASWLRGRQRALAT